MARGRPSKYKPEYCEEIVKFFTYSPYRIEDGRKVANEPKFLIDFAVSIGVTKSTLNEWVNKYEEFSDAYKKAKDLNEATLTRGAMLGVYNSGAWAFMMKNAFGWRDSKDLSVSGKLEGGETRIVLINSTNEGKEGERDQSRVREVSI